MFKKLLQRVFSSEGSGEGAPADFRSERENEVYRQRFGQAGGERIATPSDELLDLLLPGADDRFNHVGVFAYPPRDGRQDHTFVTSGLSDPWEFGIGGEMTGLGFELVFSTETSEQWPIGLLLRLMLHQLGVFRGSRQGHPLKAGDRIPLRPFGVAAHPETVTGLIVAMSEGAGRLSTGTFDFLRLIGVTTEEYAWSLSAGASALGNLLYARGLVVLPAVRGTIDEARGAILPDELKSCF